MTFAIETVNSYIKKYYLQVLDKSGRTVKLSWQAPYNGNSNLTRYVIEFKTTKGNWKNDIDHVLVPGDQVKMSNYFTNNKY